MNCLDCNTFSLDEGVGFLFVFFQFGNILIHLG